MTRRTIALIAVLGMLLPACMALWSYGQMAQSRSGAVEARADLADCLQMGAEIERCRRRPTLASDHERLADETTGLIELAAKSAGVSSGSLVRIIPQQPRRIADTIYKEKPTLVLLKSVSLRQVTALVHQLVSDENGLRAKSIRINAPRPEDTGDRWTAEIVLTYMIYDPPEKSK